ncbi:MAG TPA: hypothetical protein VGB37_05265 [Candidatus Lokiarchaeia archaeon]
MKTETFRHEKIEECNLCNKIIKTEKDNWVAVIDFFGDKLDKLKFYHQFCLTDLIRGQGKIITKNFTEKVNAVVRGLLKGIPKTNDNKTMEVFEIKNG